MEKINLSVILPIKSALTKDFEVYFDKCIKSIQNQEILPEELLIVHTQEENLVKFLKEYDFDKLNTKLIEWVKKPNFQSQINFGVENSNCEYVSFLEFDDEYSNVWFRNIKKYITVYPNVDGFLPMVVDVDEKGMFLGFTNEATFAANFSQEIGILSNETLLQYQNFQSSGMVINKQKFLNFGGFKATMKLTFVYEFFLRMTYNNLVIMTIPKIGYKHTTLREGSIFWNYKNGKNIMTEDEVKFWISTAKKEHFFTIDRNIKFVSETN
jgi:hypothetical protein